jgi:hypothetical protein
MGSAVGGLEYVTRPNSGAPKPGVLASMLAESGKKFR